MNDTVNRLRADRDRVLHKIATAPAVSNSRTMHTLVETLTRSIRHIIVTAEKRDRELTPYEQGHVIAWTSTLRMIEQDLDALKKGK